MARRSTIIALVSLAAVVRGEDWPYWRGPGTRGVSSEEGMPVRWSSSENVAFAVDVLPWGNSSPVVIGDRVYLTSQTDDTALHVIALDGRGKKVWSRQVGRGKLKAHKLHNMASPTCAAESDRVWALFGTGDLVCLDRDGEEVWRRSLTRDHGEYRILWGMATSPLILGDRLFISCQHGGPSYVLAIDKRTGEDVWKKSRDLECVGEATDSYSTPTFARVGERTELIVAGTDHVNAYDPESGRELWISSGLKIDHRYGRSIASPTAGEGYVVAVSSNFSKLGRAIALRPGGEGDVTRSRLWTFDDASPDCPTPLIYRGYVYFMRDDGIGTCVELRTGNAEWSKRIFRGDVKASPVAADGKVYFFSVNGETVVLRAGAEGEVLARNRLDGRVIATPALSAGRLWIRTREKLYAIGGNPAG